MAYPITHQHNPPLAVGGIELARVIEIINGYTVTFEDGQYSVNLSGSNSNIADVVNANQVSIRSGNSAGLVTSSAIEQTEFEGKVWVDQANGATGSVYPKGTPRRPVNNMADAYIIAQARGLKRIFFIGDYVFSATDSYSDLEFEGSSRATSTLTLTSGSLFLRSEWYRATLVGASTGFIYVEECIIDGVLAEGQVENTADVILEKCLLKGRITLPTNYAGQLRVLDCWSDVAGSQTAELDFSNASASFVIRNYSGGIQLDGLTEGQNGSIDLISGQVKIDSSCTNAVISVRGVGKLINSGSAGVIVDDEGLMNKNNITESVWNREVSDFDDNTMGDQIKHIRKTVGEPRWVSTFGSDSNDGSAPTSAFRTIQYAIDQSNAGDVINMQLGNYYENITINKTLTFIGEAGTCIAGTTAGLPTVNLTASNCIISFIKVAPQTDDIGIDVYGSGNFFERTFYQGGSIALYLREAAKSNYILESAFTGGQSYATVEIKGDENIFDNCVLNGGGTTLEGFDVEGTAAFNIFRNVDVLGYSNYELHFYENTANNLFYGNCGTSINEGTDNNIVTTASKADVINASQL
jgi:hypothetical protein